MLIIGMIMFFIVGWSIGDLYTKGLSVFNISKAIFFTVLGTVFAIMHMNGY